MRRVCTLVAQFLTHLHLFLHLFVLSQIWPWGSPQGLRAVYFVWNTALVTSISPWQRWVMASGNDKSVASSAAEQHGCSMWVEEWSSRKLQKKRSGKPQSTWAYLPIPLAQLPNWAETAAKQREHCTDCAVSLGQINSSNSWNNYKFTLTCRNP